MARTNENAFHIPGSTFLQKRGPDIFPDVVSHQEKRYPISATKIHERKPNLGPRGQRENITPMGHHVEVRLPESELRVARRESVGEDSFPNLSVMEGPDFLFAHPRSLAFNPTPRRKEGLHIGHS
jgi:hypothetical protein